MEIWRIGYGNEKLPRVLSASTLGIALAIHLSFFAAFLFFAICHGLFEKDEEIIPIDLTVVVNQNLNGKENEPPPLKNPDPPPPPKPPVRKTVVKKPDPPKALEQIVTNVVVKADKKAEKVEKVAKDDKKPKKPEKTKEQLRQERMAAMRKSATTVGPKVKIVVSNAKESGNGRTAKKTLSDAEVMRLLNMGYKPGTSEQLAANELQLGISLVRDAFYDKWDQPPWTDALKPMVVRVWFAGGGKIVKYKLEKSSGDPRADATIKSAASRVGAIPALPAAFIEKFKSGGVPLTFKVTASN